MICHLIHISLTYVGATCHWNTGAIILNFTNIGWHDSNKPLKILCPQRFVHFRAWSRKTHCKLFFQIRSPYSRNGRTRSKHIVNTRQHHQNNDVVACVHARHVGSSQGIRSYMATAWDSLHTLEHMHTPLNRAKSKVINCLKIPTPRPCLVPK